MIIDVYTMAGGTNNVPSISIQLLCWIKQNIASKETDAATHGSNTILLVINVATFLACIHGLRRN